MRVHDTVRTLGALSRKEFIADRVNKALRRTNTPGVISGILGRCNERYLVMHEGETTPAVYIREELEPELNAYWTVTYSKQGCACFSEVATYRDAEGLQQTIETDGGKVVTIDGPFFSDKELTEGLLPARSLFDHLKGDD